MSNLKTYFKLTQKIKELQQKRDEIKNKIMSEIDDELIDGNFKAKICERAYGFDQNAFRQDRPRIYQQYYIEDTYRYLSVRQINKSKAA